MATIVLAADRLQWSGALYYITMLAEGLAAKGWNITILGRCAGPVQSHIWHRNIHVQALNSSTNLLVAPLTSSRFFQEVKPALIQSCDPPAHFWTHLSPGIRQKLAFLALYLDMLPKNWFYRCLLRYLHRRDTWICTPFRSLATDLRQLGISAEKIHLVPLAIRKWPVPAKELVALKNSWRLSDDEKLIVGFSSFAPNAQIKLLVWAMDILRHVYNQVRLIILGSGPEKDRWEQFVRDLRLQDSVQLLPHVADFAPWLARADLVWLAADVPTSWFYAASALRLGKTVIAIQTPVIREIITHNETGILSPEDDPVALARYSQWCLEFPDLSRHLACNAMNYASENLDETELLRAFEDLYTDVLGQA